MRRVLRRARLMAFLHPLRTRAGERGAMHVLTFIFVIALFSAIFGRLNWVLLGSALAVTQNIIMFVRLVKRIRWKIKRARRLHI